MSKLIETRNPTREEELADVEVVFVRKDKRGTLHTIYGCTVYESWEQWGAPREILSDNVPDIEAWRKSKTNLLNS
jgi:hypothetical protein